MEIKALGIDLGKTWFQLHGVDYVRNEHKITSNY